MVMLLGVTRLYIFSYICKMQTIKIALDQIIFTEYFFIVFMWPAISCAQWVRGFIQDSKTSILCLPNRFAGVFFFFFFSHEAIRICDSSETNIFIRCNLAPRYDWSTLLCVANLTASMPNLDTYWRNRGCRANLTGHVWATLLCGQPHCSTLACVSSILTHQHWQV